MKGIVSTIIIFLSIIYGMTITAQEISVKSVAVVPSDLSARTRQRNDLNGNPCALVKVALPLANASFEGNIVGNCEFMTNEYWIYMSAGTKRLIIKCPYIPSLVVNFKEYGIERLNGKDTYNIKLSYKHPKSKISISDYEKEMGSGEKLVAEGKYEDAINLFTQIHENLVNLGEVEFASSAQSRINQCKRLIALDNLNGFEYRPLYHGRFSYMDLSRDTDLAYNNCTSDFYGVIDSIGNLISRPIFNEILEYHNGVAWVRQGLNWGNITLDGAINVPIKFQMEIIDYEGKPSCVALYESGESNGFKICDYISGQPLLSNIYTSTKARWYPSPTNFDYFCVHDKKKNKDYFIDKKSKTIRCDLGKYTHVYYLKYGLSEVCYKYAYGIVDSFGEIVLQPEFNISQITCCEADCEDIPLLSISSHKNYQDNGERIYNYKERNYINDKSYHKVYRIWDKWIIVSFWNGKREFFGIVNKDTGEELINPYTSNISEIIAPLTHMEKSKENDTSTKENRFIIKYYGTPKQDYLNRDGAIINSQ